MDNNEIEEKDSIFCLGCGYEWIRSELDMFINSEGEIICQCQECTSSLFSLSEPELPSLEEYQEGYAEGD